MQTTTKAAKKRALIGLLVSAVIVGAGATGLWAMNENTDALRRGDGRGAKNQGAGQSRTTEKSEADHAVVTPSATVLASTSKMVEDQLLYLIEEEKLAHDVYQAMYEKYGARTFSNIQASETKHQESVLALLKARGIADPRSGKAGVFTNASLQKLYDSLIAQGNKSVTDAYAVGVKIEEIDIADIEKDLQQLDPAQTDIQTTLENLKRGSENHLRAFSRKV